MITFEPAKIDWMLTLGCLLLGSGIWLLYKANRSSSNSFNAGEMFLDERDKTSMSKFFYLVGGLTATWIVIRYAVNDKLTWEMFGAYLAAFVLGKTLTEFAKKEG